MNRALPAVVLLAVVLAGCSATVEGDAVRTAPSAVERALSTPVELSQVLNAPMQVNSSLQVGGAGVLRDDKDTVSPLDCAGVPHAGHRQTYQGADVRQAARGSWKTPDGTDPQTLVTVSVVELDSPGSARSWYAKTAAQWQKCQGVTVTQRAPSFTFIEDIERTADSEGTLTAELSVSTSDGLVTPIPVQRALTTTAQYLIDVETTDTSSRPDTHVAEAVAVARLVASKITSPS
ncbi:MULTISPECIES: sensor domain-containing protein [Mycobacteroides]|jgi:predicted small secreted protein|uniref:sensor domain-containing protein n=1 Tax=Mycobacteroides TaxID=670516 RepID=UPI000C259899|nr:MULTISPECIES: sensor domain-containing protein [Mycobacteroides]MBF9327946.1 sensor domain-containing protein [Mycobacteroides chelonae]MBF9422124.1 sensor domain-containing protein [Mycobacteroides chelonae]